MLPLMFGTLLICLGCCALMYLAVRASGKPMAGGCGGSETDHARCEDCPNRRQSRCERQGAEA